MTDVFSANIVGREIDWLADAKGAPVLVGCHGVLAQYSVENALAVSVVADSRDDAEERLRRTFGDDAFVEDLELTAPLPDSLARGFRLLAHAGELCADPDCEVHHPDAIEDPTEMLPALAWFEAGRRARKST